CHEPQDDRVALQDGGQHLVTMQAEAGSHGHEHGETLW
ncbi:MAG: hypothetical protein AVDCRST_MAG48-2127, partial [uncultured Friedmanniella sp.]